MIPEKHQEPKQQEGRRGLVFVPPGDFASRVGRTVALHVQRQDWRQARHVIEAAEREVASVVKDFATDANKSVEQRAAERSIFDVPGVELRVANRLVKAGAETVADVLLMSAEELLQLPEFGPMMLQHLRESLRRAGFGELIISANEGVDDDEAA